MVSLFFFSFLYPFNLLCQRSFIIIFFPEINILSLMEHESYCIGYKCPLHLYNELTSLQLITVAIVVNLTLLLINAFAKRGSIIVLWGKIDETVNSFLIRVWNIWTALGGSTSTISWLCSISTISWLCSTSTISWFCSTSTISWFCSASTISWFCSTT